MKCRDALEVLPDYLDSQLPFRRHLSFRLHLALCRDCRNYLDTYRYTIQAVWNAYSESAVSEQLPDAVIRAILTAHSRNQ